MCTPSMIDLCHTLVEQSEYESIFGNSKANQATILIQYIFEDYIICLSLYTVYFIILIICRLIGMMRKFVSSRFQLPLGISKLCVTITLFLAVDLVIVRHPLSVLSESSQLRIALPMAGQRMLKSLALI